MVMAIQSPMKEGTYTISSGFQTKDRPDHRGVDYAAPKGTPFYAVADGVVVEGSERNGVVGFGKWVWLDCQESVGKDFIYGHGDPAVRGGQVVKAGQLIGYVNSYGESTGPHLHFEAWSPPGRSGGYPVDPARLGSLEVPKVAGQLKNPITRHSISPNKHKAAQNISWIAIHTQQGRGEADDILPWLNNPQAQVSYHIVVDDHQTVLNVPLDWCPWSASNANNRAIHILLAGTFAEWGTAKWLETDASDGVNEDLMLTRGAEVVAWLHQQYPHIPLVYVGGGTKPPNRNGVCGHVDFGAWGGGHWDPGNNFPWTEFIRRAVAFDQGGTMGFLDEQFENYKKSKVHVRTVLFYMDKMINELHDQIAKGWDQLGRTEPTKEHPEGLPLTIVDNLAKKDEVLDKIASQNGQILDLQKKMLTMLEARETNG